MKKIEKTIDYWYKKFIRFFARFGLKHFPNYLKPIKQEIEQSELRIVYETYIGKMFFFTDRCVYF